MKLLLTTFIAIFILHSTVFAQDSTQSKPSSNIIKLDYKHKSVFYYNNQIKPITEISGYFKNNPMAIAEYNRFCVAGKRQPYYTWLSILSMISSQILIRDNQKGIAGALVFVSSGFAITAIKTKQNKYKHLYKAVCLYNQAN